MVDPKCLVILQRFSGMESCPPAWPDDWRPHGPALVRRWSTVYRLDSASTGMSICVKVVTGGTAGLEESRTLYEALCHYHARSDREKGYTVPEPYGWVPEHRAVIMEWVEGRTYAGILKREFFSPRKRRESLAKVAGWLRWFHEQSPVERESLENHRQLKGIVKLFGKAGEPDRPGNPHDSVLSGQLDVAARASGVLHGNEIECALLHGDFKPTNVILSRSGVVTGIDIADGRRGPVSHDICRFLSDVDFYRILSGRRFRRAQPAVPDDFGAFLAAYYGGEPAIGGNPFRYLYFLTVLSVLVNQRKKFQGGLAAVIRLAVYRRIAMELSTGFERPAVAKGGQVGWMMWRLLPPVIMEWGLVVLDSADLMACLG